MLREVIDKQVLELKKLWANKRQLLFQCLNLAMIVFSALMIWKGLMFVTKVRGDTAGLQGAHQIRRCCVHLGYFGCDLMWVAW